MHAENENILTTNTYRRNKTRNTISITTEYNGTLLPNAGQNLIYYFDILTSTGRHVYPKHFSFMRFCIKNAFGFPPTTANIQADLSRSRARYRSERDPHPHPLPVSRSVTPETDGAVDGTVGRPKPHVSHRCGDGGVEGGGGSAPMGIPTITPAQEYRAGGV